MDTDDEVLTTLPVYLSSRLSPNLHLHQYPLLTRPIQVPPSAASSGKRIKAKCKPTSERFEVHIPVDVRSEVWNVEKGSEYGAARAEEDQEERVLSGQGDQKKERKPKAKKLKTEKDLFHDPDNDMDDATSSQRLAEVRLRSEAVKDQGDYYVGVVRDGELHLHPVSKTYQFRPTYTYLDVLSKKSKTAVVEDDEEDEDAEKKAKPAGKEVQVSARALGEVSVNPALGGLSSVRREMLTSMREEQKEPWQALEWNGDGTLFSEEMFESLFSQGNQALTTRSRLRDTLNAIKGLDVN